jgi:retinol dehydrogenase 12
LIPLLIAADGARIVNLASEAHFFAFGYAADKFADPPHYNDLIIYGRSKLANILFSNELAERLAHYNITSNAVHPGTVSSNFAGDGDGLTALFMKLFRPFLRTPVQAAADVVEVATAPKFADVTGRYLVNARPARRSAKASNKLLARELWSYIEDIIYKIDRI